MKDKLFDWIFNSLGDDFGGHPRPPGTKQELEFGDFDNGSPMYVATTYNNDGFELWLGTSYEWHIHFAAQDARRLAWFILWQWWIVGTWCGLKRWLWYTALDFEIGDR